MTLRLLIIGFMVLFVEDNLSAQEESGPEYFVQVRLNNYQHPARNTHFEPGIYMGLCFAKKIQLWNWTKLQFYSNYIFRKSSIHGKSEIF